MSSRHIPFDQQKKKKKKSTRTLKKNMRVCHLSYWSPNFRLVILKSTYHINDSFINESYGHCYEVCTIFLLHFSPLNPLSNTLLLSHKSFIHRSANPPYLFLVIASFLGWSISVWSIGRNIDNLGAIDDYSINIQIYDLNSYNIKLSYILKI